MKDANPDPKDKKTELNLVDDLKTEQKKIKYRDFLRRTFF